MPNVTFFSKINDEVLARRLCWCDKDVVKKELEGLERNRIEFIVKFMIKEYPKNVVDLPLEDMDFELAMSAVLFSLELVEQNKDYYSEACWGDIFKKLPKKFKTQDICKNAWTKDKALLRYIPEEFITQDMITSYCIETGQVNEKFGYSLESIPTTFRNYDVCSAMVKERGLDIQYVPKDLIDQELCNQASLNNAHAFEYMPHCFRTYDIHLRAVQRCHAFRENLLFKIPSEHKDRALIRAYIDKQCAVVFLSSEEKEHLRKTIEQEAPRELDYLNETLQKDSNPHNSVNLFATM